MVWSAGNEVWCNICMDVLQRKIHKETLHTAFVYFILHRIPCCCDRFKLWYRWKYFCDNKRWFRVWSIYQFKCNTEGVAICKIDHHWLVFCSHSVLWLAKWCHVTNYDIVIGRKWNPYVTWPTTSNMEISRN